jgi:hypothetical protein
MPSGLLFPYSVNPITVGCYNGAYNKERCTKVSASIAADAKVELYYAIPDPLPGGTFTLRARARAAATSGGAKVNFKWARVAMEEDPDSQTLQAEGTQTITWASGDTDQYKTFDLTLDADTPPSAGEIVRAQAWFETSSWSLAAISGWTLPVLWL